MFDSSPNSSAKSAVAGTDITPRNTGERKNFHYIEQIFDPDKHPIEDLHRYVVPQELELVFDVPNGVIYFVSHVAWQVNLKSTLVPWAIQNTNDSNTTEQDWIFGLRGGPGAGEALLAIDFSIRPNRAQIDSTILRPGATYAKLFLGNDVSENGKVISAQYDQTFNMLNNTIPVKLAEIVDRSNINIMTTGSFSVTENEESLSNGTRCTVVFYDAGGNWIPPVQPVMVQHSSYMRDHQIGTKYLTEIELLSPWFTDTSNPEKLTIPINVNLASIELRAVAHYSDGSKADPQPVNGSFFALHGLNQYRPKWPGQTGEVVLVRTLQSNEQHYKAEPGNPNFKTRTYEIMAGAVKGAYSPRIYTYPQWDATLGGYKLLHFLYDLDRRSFVNVTDKVTFNALSPAYRPSSYGITQSLVFNLNLRDVSNLYESVIFIQHTEITLLANVNGPGTRWTVNYVQEKAPYKALFANTKNNGVNTTVNLTNGFATQAAWLDGMYWAVQPSYDTINEEKAPTPTHFYIMHEDGRKWVFPLASWNANNVLPIELQKGKTFFVNWVHRLASGDELQLATTGVTVELI